MRINDASIQLSLVQKPAGFRAQAGSGVVQLLASPIQITARCQVEPDFSFVAGPANLVSRVSPRNAPWKLGFMQLQVLETAWSYYRGAQSQDGSVLNDEASSRGTSAPCRDYDRSSGSVWYEGSANIVDCYGIPDVSRRPPWNLEFYYGDNPVQDCNDHVLNPQTQRYNYLYEARCALAFVTTLTEQTSPGVFKHHRHFYWSVIWHIQSTSPNPASSNTNFNLLPGSGFWISEFRRGAPHDPRYRAVLDNPALTTSCNEVAGSTPVAKSVSSTWERFPLMDRKDSLFGR